MCVCVFVCVMCFCGRRRYNRERARVRLTKLARWQMKFEQCKVASTQAIMGSLDANDYDDEEADLVKVRNRYVSLRSTLITGTRHCHSSLIETKFPRRQCVLNCISCCDFLRPQTYSSFIHDGFEKTSKDDSVWCVVQTKKGRQEPSQSGFGFGRGRSRLGCGPR